MERKNSYIYGSTAPSFPERQERNDTGRKAQSKPDIKALPYHSHLPKSKMIFCVLFVAAVSFVLLYRYSVIAELNYKMGNLNAEYSRLVYENRKLEVEIATSINLDRVKEIAETELNMHSPESYQVVEVSVPKNNYSVVVDHDYIDQTIRHASLTENILNIVRAILP